MEKDYNETDKSTEQVKKLPNPTGKGGFQDHPELRNNGGRPKNNESFVYWYRVFKDMTVSELKEWQQNNPESTRSVASDLAYTRVVASKSSLKDFLEVANRSEGMPKQRIENTNAEVSEGLKLIKSIINNTDVENVENVENIENGENGENGENTETSQPIQD